VKQGEIALAGEPVQAVMMGRVAAVIEDRFPYGNALLLETPLQALPPDWLDPGWIPALAPTLSSNPALTCPTPAAPPALDFSRRSLYVLYAHMQAKADYQLGQTVRCGEQIGEIGQSGNALAPHLHLEVRVGPSGERFVGLAHYETRASSEEMSNYCVWRVSGVYQLVDPLQLLAHLDD
jgi:murein DD-endopeptidase MepM/ murein hydrolase activator NlpD